MVVGEGARLLLTVIIDFSMQSIPGILTFSIVTTVKAGVGGIDHQTICNQSEVTDVVGAFEAGGEVGRLQRSEKKNDERHVKVSRSLT